MDESNSGKKLPDEFPSSDCQDITIKIVHYLEFVIIFFIALIGIRLYLIISSTSSLLFIILIITLLILLICYPLCVSFNTRRLIQTFPENNCKNQHHAIIIAHKTSPKSGKFTYMDYLSGADILIKRFRIDGKKINYSVYEVQKKEQVIPIILNENTTHLWIFGHGMRNKLGLNGENLCYYEVRSAPKKTFIGQYHCNSFLGKSLADYNNPKNQDVTHFARMDPFIRISVWRKLKELDEKGLL
jgi:hypothetical protein